MGTLTTHVLDIARDTPAAGIVLALYREQDGGFALLLEAITNADGHCSAPLLCGPEIIAGRYRLTFRVGTYFAAQGCALSQPPFVDTVVLDFGITDPAADYHVPLLVSPWSYSTYRGG